MAKNKKSKTVDLSDEEIIALFAGLLTRLVSEADEDVDADDDEDDEAEDDDESEDDEDEGDEDGDDEEESDEDDDSPWDEDSLAELEREDLKGLADEYEIEYTPKTATKTLITKILEAQEAEMEGDEDEEDDDEADDDDSDEFWTEKELKGKSLAELRTIAKEYDLPVKGKSEKDLIKAIVEA